MQRWRKLSSWLIMFSACAGALHAEEKKNPLEVSMHAEQSTVAPGSVIQVGFLLHNPASYHTYWKHPGIVGLATKIVWDLPQGFTAGEVVWPAPDRVKMAIYSAQGYERDVLLMVPVTVPKQFTDQVCHLRARLSWMCCSDHCYPAQNVPFSLDVPVGEITKIDEKNHTLFEQQRAQVPQVDPAWVTSVTVDQDAIRLTIQAAAGNSRSVAELGELWFFTGDGAVDSSKPQRVIDRQKDRLTLELIKSEFAPKVMTSLPGVLSAAKDGQGTKFIEINPVISSEK